MKKDNMIPCLSLTGAHKYEARYDEVPHNLAKQKLEANCYVSVEREDSIRKIYVEDICALCGDVIDRLIDNKEIK